MSETIVPAPLFDDENLACEINDAELESAAGDIREKAGTKTAK